jgi:hypothetical protein
MTLPAVAQVARQGQFLGLPSFVPPRDAVLTTEQVAEWLQISPQAVRELNLPAIRVGRGKRQRWRYLASMVLDALAKRAE